MKHVFLTIALLAAIGLGALPPLHAQQHSYTVYAALYEENNLAIIDPSQGRIIQRIQVGRNPDWLFLNADKSKVYTINTGEYSVSVVDLAEKREIQSLRLPVNRRGIYAGPSAASPDATRLFVGETADKTQQLRIYVIDMDKVKQIGQFDVGKNINSISVSHDGKKLFVVDKDAKSVTVYDAETYGTIGKVPLIPGFEGKVECIACSPAAPKAFITYGDANKLQVINTDTYKTISTLDMPKYKTGFQRDIYVQRDGKYAFIINDKNDLKDIDGVLVYDVAKNEIIKIFDAGHVPRGMTTTADNLNFFVASNYLKWYNLLTLEHLKSMSLRTEIRGIVVIEK